MIAHGLKQPTRAVQAEKCLGDCSPRRPYSVLLPVGFTMPSPVAGDAVRSYRTLSLSLDRSLSDLLSVALSLRLPSPAVSWHRLFVEPGLSSPYSYAAVARPPGRYAPSAVFCVSHPLLAWGATAPKGWPDIRHPRSRRSVRAENVAETQQPPPFDR